MAEFSLFLAELRRDHRWPKRITEPNLFGTGGRECQLILRVFARLIGRAGCRAATCPRHATVEERRSDRIGFDVLRHLVPMLVRGGPAAVVAHKSRSFVYVSAARRNPRSREMRIKKIPTTVVTGFLGAGKTTLVNHIYDHTRPMPIGIVVNEFGEVGIDGQLIVADEDAIIEINNGCVCCTVRSDLVESVLQLLARYGDKLERLIVETSGLADPAPVLQTFLADPDVCAHVELESVIAVVDARHAHGQLSDDIAREQIVFADRIVINKTDLVAPSALAALESSIRALNPTATLDFVTRS